MEQKQPPVYDEKPSNMISQVIYSFRVAFSGLFHVLLTQRNMRFHFSIALWVMSFAIIFDLSGFQKSFLFIIITFVLSMEVLNTCIEALTDVMSPEYNENAKIAKDTAAAAVLAVSIGSLMSAGYLLIPPFFRSAQEIDWLKEHHREIIAIAVIVCSVLGFWLIRALKLLPEVFLLIGCAASSVSITLLSVYGRDWLTFCALQFFSILLFNAIARSDRSLKISVIGHLAGVVIYMIVASAL